MSNEKLQLSNIIGDGFVQFTLTEMSRKLMVRYTSKDMVNGIQNLGWKFNESTDQYEMFDQILKDLAMHNFMLSGLSKEEAIRAVKEMSS